MTIRQTLQDWSQKRLAKLIELHAPSAIIASVERGTDHIDGIAKYGDLEVESTQDLTPDDAGLMPITMFNCANIKEILMYTEMDDSKPFDPLINWVGYPCTVKLVRVPWSLYSSEATLLATRVYTTR